MLKRDERELLSLSALRIPSTCLYPNCFYLHIRKPEWTPETSTNTLIYNWLELRTFGDIKCNTRVCSLLTLLTCLIFQIFFFSPIRTGLVYQRDVCFFHPPPTSLSDKNSRVRTALKFPREARVSKRALIYVANGDVFAPRGHVITDCLRRRCVWASEYFSVSVRGEPKLRQQYENTIQQSIIAKYTVWEASGGFCFCFVSQLRKRLISGGGSKIRVARRLKYGK